MTDQQFPFVARANGRISWPGGEAPCVFGRGGLVEARRKREGDGGTPVGFWPMRQVFWRPDRVAQPETCLHATPLAPDMGWCDDPVSSDYNRPVDLPFPYSHELLWREDHLYDLIVVLGWNDDPVIAGRGSAIFLHLAAPAGTPTEGCVATDLASLQAILRAATPDAALVVEGPTP
jgi:L,D-peptidoglycan transpeptidase YkuD (ErfK/YbiS/YcfS/YnhG family)